MTSSFSPDLRLELMATGDQSGTWGDTTNTNLGTLLEQAICGVLSVAEGDTTLTLTALNGASDQSRNAVLNLTGAMTAGRNVVVPTSQKLYLVKNSTTGGFAVTVKTAAGTGVAIAAGTSQWVYCDGTNVVQGLLGGFAPDANNNVSVNNAFLGFTTTATAAGTTTLTVASTPTQVFTGTTTQVVVLPTTSIPAGAQYEVINNSTGAVTVQSSGANTIVILAAGTSGLFTAVVVTPTTAANWDAQYLGLITASGKSLTVSNSLTLAGTDATTMTFPSTSATIARTDAANTFTGIQTFNTALTVASGGTGRGTLTLNNVLLGNGTTAVQLIAPGTSGNVLTSDGTTWASTAAASSGQPIPTGSSYAIGIFLQMFTAAGPTADGATIAGSSLKAALGSGNSTVVQTGTWTNRTGQSIGAGAIGLFVRTA